MLQAILSLGECQPSRQPTFANVCSCPAPSRGYSIALTTRGGHAARFWEAALDEARAGHSDVGDAGSS